jgi:hypothetical protein
VVDPSVKVTEPVGVPPDELTVAVKVTDWPKTDGFAEEVTTVAVVGWPIPVPLRPIDDGIMLKPFATVSFPLRAPAAPGVKVTLMVQVPPAASGEEEAQLSVSRKSPPAVRLRILSGAAPAFVTVSCWDALLVPTFWLPKLRVVGLKSMTCFET